MARRDTFITGIFILIVAAITFLAHTGWRPVQPSSLSSNATLRQSEQAFDQILQSSGSAAAYQYFLDKFGPVSPSENHELAHYIGDRLFTKEGVAAVTICDFTQNWGCFHSLVKDIF